MLYNSGLRKSLVITPLLPANYQQVTSKLNLCQTRYIPRTSPFHFISHYFHKSLYLRSLYHRLYLGLVTNLTTNLTTSMTTSLFPNLFLCLFPTSVCNGRIYEIADEPHFHIGQLLPCQYLLCRICILTNYN